MVSHDSNVILLVTSPSAFLRSADNYNLNARLAAESFPYRWSWRVVIFILLGKLNVLLIAFRALIERPRTHKRS